jgi:hypothetical protein
VLPSIAAYPRADHWGDGDFPPGLNPTAAIAGLLHALGVDHPWLDKATDFCWRELDRELPHDAHGLAVTSESPSEPLLMAWAERRMESLHLGYGGFALSPFRSARSSVSGDIPEHRPGERVSECLAAFDSANDRTGDGA